MTTALALENLDPAQKRALLLKLLRAPPEPQLAQEGPFPLSQGQAALCFLQQLAPDDPAYNVLVPLRLSVSLDVGAFKRAFEALIERHGALRTELQRVDGEPKQHQRAGAPVVWKEADAAAWSATEVERWLTAEAYRPFDLFGGPLYRLALLRRGEGEHLFLLAIHHMLFDGGSVRTLVDELRELYARALKGEPLQLPALAKSYATHVQAEAELVHGPEGEALFSYWKEQLKGALPSIELPPRSSAAPNEAKPWSGSDVRFDLSPEVSDRLRAVGEAEGATPYMLLLAALACVLHRHSGQEDLVIGAFTGTRDGDHRRVVGYFVNALPLRIQVSSQTSFAAVVRLVRDVVLGAVEHARYPFPQLVRQLRPERTDEGAPFMNVVFNMISANHFGGLASHFGARDGERRASEGDVLGIESYAMPKRASRFPLEVTFGDTGDGGLRGLLEFGTTRFSQSAMDRLAGHLVRALEAAAAAPETLVGELPLLSEQEREQILFAWNPTPGAGPGLSAHGLFEAQARATPDAPAIHFGDETLSYAELDRRANALAARLRALGVSANVPVGICLDRSTQMMVALLATLKAGGAYVPLDPGYPAERLLYMTRHSKMACLVTQDSHAGIFPPDGPTLVRVDSNEAPTSLPTSSADSRGEDIAYVIYTSGSTGTPKGVQVPHRALVNLLSSMRKAPGLSSDDRLLALTTISFDIAALELFLPLTIGAQVDIASREDALDGHRLGELISQRQITVVQATPATWRMLVHSGWAGSPRLKVLCGGEAMAAELAQALLPRCSELWNVYGPTETTVWSTAHRVDASLRGEIVPVGGPIDNTVLRILDGRGRAVPIGVKGELMIGGEGLAHGYHLEPTLTAQRFFTARPEGLPEERLYRTGDVARWNEAGQVEVLGRSDNQVKVRGFRVELGEVEAALERHPAVSDCAVVVRDDALWAYVVPTAGVESDAARLRGFLSDRLPPYMVPSFTFLATLPLTPNGKVDRRALPAPQRAVAPQGPRSELPEPAKRIAAMWAELLKLSVDDLGLEDSFFALGGHSLLLGALALKLEAEFEVQVRVADLYAHPTLASLFQWLTGTRDNVGAAVESGQQRGTDIRGRLLERRRRRR